jgi:hypothetical protein
MITAGIIGTSRFSRYKPKDSHTARSGELAARKTISIEKDFVSLEDIGSPVRSRAKLIERENLSEEVE